MSAGRECAPGERGAIFIEAVIAAAMVALALGSTFQVIADSARRDRAAGERRAALLIAQSELAATGSEIPLRTGESAGIVGDMVWRVDVSPYQQGDEKQTAGALWKVAVSVRPRRSGANLVMLDSIRLGAGA